MTDSDDEIALIEQQLAQRKERKRARDDEQRRREALLPKQLVPDSPSPRKKRRPSTDASTLLARTPPPPRFFEKSPLERTFNPSDKVEMRSARGGTKGSKFESHLSAVPKGFAQIMSNSISVARAEQDKKRAVEERRRQSRQSALASSSSTSLVKLDQLDKEAREVLMSGKKGEGAMLRPRKEKEKEGKGAREKEKALLAATSTASFTKPTTTTPAISRATPSTSSKLAPSSSSFGSIRPSTPAVDDSLEITDGPSRRTRNKDGTVINEIEIGPWEFPARADDPEWEKVEPYSGIRLRERLIPHSAIQDLLTGRYPLLPSLLYALSRIDSRNRIELNHEVVDADYVVFGVLAWKDEVRFLNGGVGRGQGGGEGKKEGEEGNGEESNEEELVTDGKGKKKASSTSASQDPLFRPPTRRSRRLRYIRFDLIDLSTPRASASATGQLSLMLVQADSVDKAVDEDGNEMEVYKGQSGGAYERYWKESPGAVVAIVNPIFLPHNKAYSYTIKPTSADSVHVIGRAENLTFCEAIKKDGRQCGKWVDARTGKFCQFHVELAIKRTGVRSTASLAQKGTFNHSHFKKSLGSSSTSSGSLDSAAPAQQPLAKFVAGSTTYVTTGTRSSTITMPRGGLLSTSSSSSRAGGFIHGLREGPSVLDEKKRLKKVVEDEKRAREERKQLRRLDKGRTAGGEYLIRSSRRVKTEGDGKGEKRGKKRKRTPDDEDDDEPSEARGASAGSSSDEEDEDVKPNLSSVFKADALRKIGFNPTAKPGDLPRDESSETKRYRLALESGLAHREIKLSAPKPPPKPKVKSRVAEAPAMNTDDDDLVIEGGPG
ncbi:zinc finger, Mcm10/DnaG-type domain containing protein [Rhodotorula toruloides]|uniref:Zinc finger, Mcm10/DnaG-type domain containing protein n=1 Tax=Rhodotorula toruloides TaxID=5286 RepID=A0A511KQ92_RHOTO|nr:zinc finger, Mcm10/DnaG-type domain containing protein [Rhodotorula toruloides]